MVKRSFEYKHAAVLAAQATRFSRANIRASNNGFEVDIRSGSPSRGYSHDNNHHEFSYPILRWRIVSPFQSLVARASAKLLGLDKLAEKIADQAMADIAKHEAMLVMRGSLERPAGWDALDERSSLGESIPACSAAPSRRPGL